MTVYTWPTDWLTKYTESVRFRLTPFSLSSQPLFGGVRRAYGPVRHYWMVDITTRELGPTIWRDMSGFISKLDGISGLAKLFDPDRILPRGMAAGWSLANIPPTTTWTDGTIWTDGTPWSGASRFATVSVTAYAGAEYVTISGLFPSQPTALASGDMIEIGGCLYEVSSATASDATGSATVQIRPRLRVDTVASTQVTLAWAGSVFALADDNQGTVERERRGWQDNVKSIGRLSLSFIEIPQI